MRFIDIQPGFSIEVDSIIAIEETESGSKLHTKGGAFNSLLSRETILMIIRTGDQEKEEMGDLRQMVDTIKRNAQHFGG